MMKHFIKMAAIALVCASCSNELPEMVTGSQSDVPKTNLEYALEYAEDLIGQIDPQTRGVSREANVQFVCSPATRSGRQDTLLYLVNYADNMGFALLDAEGKNGGVYAISPKGHLEFSDSVNNPLLAHFFRKVKEAASESVIQTRDQIIGWGPGYIAYVVGQADPLLCERYADWDCNGIKGAAENGTSEANVTTAAVVLAKMLAYYYHPSVIAGTPINWKFISGSTKKDTEINKLLIALNSKEILKDTSTGSTGTGDETRKIYPSMVDGAVFDLLPEVAEIFAMSGTDFFSNYEENKEMKKVLGPPLGAYTSDPNQIPYGPFIVFAQPKDEISGNIESFYRYWIIDGYIDRRKVAAGTSVLPVNIAPNLPSLYHCIWGMKDYVDGYYAFDTGCIVNNLSYDDGGQMISEKQDEQCLFPKPGVIGGFYITPLAQP